MNKIWFDVTSILQWHRPAVGIIRVESQCAKYALDKMQNDVKFCRFDNHEGYCSVSPEIVREAIDRINQVQSHKEPNQSNLSEAVAVTTTLKIPMISRIAIFIKRMLSSLPKKTQGDIFHFLSIRREAAFSVIHGLCEFRRAWHIWWQPIPTKVISSAPEPKTPEPKKRHNLFSQGDVYISLGFDWNQKDLQFIAEQKARNNFKTIFSCYDVIPVKFPHLCVGDVASTFARYFADLAWCADEFVVNSECSRRDLEALLDELGAPIRPTTVVKLGSNLLNHQDVPVSNETKNAAGERFILFVSTIERRKNHETLYRAYTRLVDEGRKNLPRLIFVGMHGWGVKDFLSDLQLDHRIKDLIRILTNVSDADLAWLYRHAMFTVFPSLYEGWGLAIAESLSAGKFCIASNVASIPEVGGSLVEYLDPWNVPQWAERLKCYFDNPALLTNREKCIREEYIPPTWAGTAQTIFRRAEALLSVNNKSDLPLSISSRRS